jgi:hypothetical protein
VITEFLLSMGLPIFEWVLQFLPRMTEAEGVVLTATNSFLSVIEGAASLGTWIPWSTVAFCLPITITVFLGSFMFKIGRALLSHVPFVGGRG